MNSKFKSFISNIFRAVSVNVIRLLISIVLTLFLPMVMGVEEYSYWQLYQFYLTYAVYSSLGWCEGLYLKHGGKKYDSLNKSDVAGQFWSLSIFEVIFNSLIFFVLILNITDGNKQAALAFAFISAFLDILRYCLQSILQTTNRIADYARIATAERIMYFVFVLIVLAFGGRDFKSLIYAELLARLLSLIYAVIICRKLVLTPLPSMQNILRETKSVLNLGYKLLLANFAGQLIIGIVRFGIENHWGTVVFGKVSLTLSLSNMVVTCISAVGIVLFPMLKQTDPDKLKRLYGIVRVSTTLPILVVLIFYTPISFVLEILLPQYADSLKYLAVLLPVCIFEARSFMLTNTYFNIYGQGGKILLVNSASVALSIVLTAITVFGLNNLDMAVLSIVLLVAFKNIFAELLLQKKLSRNAIPDILLEQGLTWVFIFCNFTMNGLYATLIYVACFLLYLFIKRKELASTFKEMKSIIKGKS